MVKLYVLNNSRHSQDAERLLKEKGFEFETIDASEPVFLSRIDLELGITQLPAVVTRERSYEGMEQIRAFVSGV